MPGVAAILLAAGESKRMGEPKALLPWQDSPSLLAYQLAQLAAVDDVSAIVLVSGHEAERIERVAAGAPKTRIARNDAYRTGKVSSILAGLQAAPEDATAVLLLAVDQPRPAALLRALVEAHRAAGARITVPAHLGHRGHPVIFDASLREELRAIDEATQGIRAVLRRHAAEVYEVPFEDAAVLLDLNTPEDVAGAQHG